MRLRNLPENRTTKKASRNTKKLNGDSFQEGFVAIREYSELPRIQAAMGEVMLDSKFEFFAKFTSILRFGFFLFRRGEASVFSYSSKFSFNNYHSNTSFTEESSNA